MSDDFFAPPPFNADDALQRAQRELRALGLTAREGRFERQGLAVARVALDAGVLKAGLVRRIVRTPEWQERTLKDHAALRTFIADVKRRLASTGDQDD